VRTFFLILCAGALCSCTNSSRSTVQADPEIPSVAVARATRQTMTHELVLSAEFRPYQEVDVHAKVAGFLKEIRVDIGDRVADGQLIATLEIPELIDEDAQAGAAKKKSEADLTTAKGELSRAQSAHEIAHLQYQRLADLAKAHPNYLAQQEVDNAQAKDRETQAQVDSAQSAITSAEQQIMVSQAAQQRVRTFQAYQRITAPFPGVISKRYADTGAMIQAGTSSSSQSMPVVRVSETDKLRLVLAVPESAVPRIHVGDPIEVRVEALHRSYQDKVSRFSERLQTSTRTMDTEVDIENPKGDLVPGMFAEAVVTLERKNNTLAVPVQIVTSDSNAATVLVVEDGRLASKNVTLGMETADKREILTGLADGDLVVMSKVGSLKPGDRVNPQEAK